MVLNFGVILGLFDAYVYTVRPREGVQAPLAFSIVNWFLYGVFVWARKALNSQKRWFPTRAVRSERLRLV